MNIREILVFASMTVSILKPFSYFNIGNYIVFDPEYL